MNMKASLFSLLTVAFLGACASGEDPLRQVGHQFEEGITGHGQIVPIDQPDDPYIYPSH